VTIAPRQVPDSLYAGVAELGRTRDKKIGLPPGNEGAIGK
jgi:hypothetical protein